MRIVITAQTETWQGGTAGRVNNVTAHVEGTPHSYYGESECADLDVRVGDTVYAVVADYETGSSVGRSGGHASVLDAFTTLAEAEALLEAAQTPKREDEGYGYYVFQHNGKDYSRSWVGHFESLNALEIWDVIVRQNPADPIKRGPGRYSLRRGD